MLLSALKKKLLSLGVRFLEADITGVTVEQNEVKKVKASRSYSNERCFPIFPSNVNSSAFPDLQKKLSCLAATWSTQLEPGGHGWL